MMKTVDHVSFTVGDLDRAVEFYSFLLGREPYVVGQESSDHAARVIGYSPLTIRYAWFQLPGGPLLLELFQYLEPEGSAHQLHNYHVGNGHIGLVVDDIEAEMKRMASAGASFTAAQPVEITQGTWRGSKVVYMKDPDGITIELMESPPEHAIRFEETI